MKSLFLSTLSLLFHVFISIDVLYFQLFILLNDFIIYWLVIYYNFFINYCFSSYLIRFSFIIILLFILNRYYFYYWIIYYQFFIFLSSYLSFLNFFILIYFNYYFPLGSCSPLSPRSSFPVPSPYFQVPLFICFIFSILFIF